MLLHAIADPPEDSGQILLACGDFWLLQQHCYIYFYFYAYQ